MSENAAQNLSFEAVIIGETGEPLGVVDWESVIETEVAARTYTTDNLSTGVVGFDNFSDRDEKENPARHVFIETTIISVEGSSYAGFVNKGTEWLRREHTFIKTIQTRLPLSAS